MRGPSVWIPFAVVALASSPLSADVTNAVDVAALAAFGGDAAGSTNGWTVSGVDAYAGKDEPPNFRLNRAAEFAISPEFGDEIVRLVLRVKSSAQADRRLAFLPWLDSAFDESRALACGYSPTKDTYVDRTLEVTNGCSFSRFKIALLGGGSTGWGVSRLWVVTRDPLRPPAGLAVAVTNALSCTLVWTNGTGAVSNEVSVSRLDWSPTAETTCFATTFDELSAGGNPCNYTAEIPRIYPGLGGEWLYAPSNTVGILQISKGTARGVLTCAGLSDYARAALRLEVKRHPGDHAAMAVRWTDGVRTNVCAALPLTDAFVRHEVDLGGVPSGAGLLIGSDDEIASNRRILVDSLEIFRRGSGGETPVGSFAVPAAGETARVQTCGRVRLRAASACRFEVRSVSADGRRSEPVAVDVRLEPAAGVGLLLR